MPSAASPTLASAMNGSGAVRDELVRAVMPELRVLLEHLVKTAVDGATTSLLDRQRELETRVQRDVSPSRVAPHELEAAVQRAIAPLLDKHRELEAKLQDLRHAALRPQGTPSIVAQRAPDFALAPGTITAAPRAPAAPFSALQPAISVAPRHVAALPEPIPARAVAPAFDANDLLDIPASLDGSRRKRTVIWLLATVVILGLATVAGLAALSHGGKYL